MACALFAGSCRTLALWPGRFASRHCRARTAACLLLYKQPHQPQRLHVGTEGKPPAGKPVLAIVQLDRADAGMIEMAQLQPLRWRLAWRQNVPAGPALAWAEGKQAPVGQGQQALGKAQLLVQVNRQSAQNVLLTGELRRKPFQPEVGRTRITGINRRTLVLHGDFGLFDSAH